MKKKASALLGRLGITEQESFDGDLLEIIAFGRECAAEALEEQAKLFDLLVLDNISRWAVVNDLRTAASALKIYAPKAEK